MLARSRARSLPPPVGSAGLAALPAGALRGWQSRSAFPSTIRAALSLVVLCILLTPDVIRCNRKTPRDYRSRGGSMAPSRR